MGAQREVACRAKRRIERIALARQEFGSRYTAGEHPDERISKQRVRRRFARMVDDREPFDCNGGNNLGPPWSHSGEGRSYTEEEVAFGRAAMRLRRRLGRYPEWWEVLELAKWLGYRR